MNKDLFFNKLAKALNLGNLVNKPLKVEGGLTHKMFKVTTDKGDYIVKLLNPKIMERDEAKNNFNQADFLEEILKKNNISAIYSLVINEKKMQEIDNKYFYVYPYYEGRVLNQSEITSYHCDKVGKVLAKIHNLDLRQGSNEIKTKDINFEYYIKLAKERKSPVYEVIFDKLEILNESMNKGNEAISKLPKVLSICHNDLDCKNVMWLDKEYKIIDLECLGYANPYLELYEVALCFSGYQQGRLDFDLFNAIFKAYFDNTNLDIKIDWESIYYANNARLEWLEFNLKRALMLECKSKEEQKMGINQVMETIKQIIYYKEIKEKILDNINKLMK